MKPITRLVLVTALAGAALALTLPEGAAAAVTTAPVVSSGITVEGVGEVAASPDLLEVRARITATGEVASDAFELFSEQRTRALAGLESAGIDGLSVRGLGPRLSYFEGPSPEDMMAGGGAIIFGGGQPMESEPSVRYREEFVLTVAGVDQLAAGGQAALVARMLDAAVDTGMELTAESGGGPSMLFAAPMPQSSATPSALVSLSVSDPAQVEQAAFAAAMQHARQRAETLAELAGQPLGPVESIEVLDTPGNWTSVDAPSAAAARLRVRFAFP